MIFKIVSLLLKNKLAKKWNWTEKLQENFLKEFQAQELTPIWLIDWLKVKLLKEIVISKILIANQTLLNLFQRRRMDHQLEFLLYLNKIKRRKKLQNQLLKLQRLMLSNLKRKLQLLRPNHLQRMSQLLLLLLAILRTLQFQMVHIQPSLLLMETILLMLSLLNHSISEIVLLLDQPFQLLNIQLEEKRPDFLNNLHQALLVYQDKFQMVHIPLVLP